MKSKVKGTMLLVGTITTVITVCVFFGFFGQAQEDVIVNRIVGIVAIVSGVGSLFVGVASMFSTSLDNVREYYATGDAKELCDARHVLYNYRYIRMKYEKSIYDEDFNEWAKEIKDKEIKPTTKEEVFAAAVITFDFFQMWGLLQSKGFLPMWVFETASGYSIIKLCEACEDILRESCATNPFYAGQFKALCIRIDRKYRKAVTICREVEKDYIQKNLGIADPWKCKCFTESSLPFKY